MIRRTSSKTLRLMEYIKKKVLSFPLFINVDGLSAEYVFCISDGYLVKE